MSHAKLKDDKETEDDKERVARLETSLKKKGDEIKQLLGRIKGYETLNHLFQEVKQENAQQKKYNEELQHQLVSLQDVHPVGDSVSTLDASNANEEQEDRQKKVPEITENSSTCISEENKTKTSINPPTIVSKNSSRIISPAKKDNKTPVTTDRVVDMISLPSSTDDYDSRMFDPYAPLLPKKAPKKKKKSQGIANPGFENLPPEFAILNTAKEALAQERDVSLSFPSLQQKNWSGSGSSSPNSTKNQSRGSSPDVLSSHLGILDHDSDSHERTDSIQYYLQKLVDKFQVAPFSSSFVSEIVHLVPRAVKMEKQGRLQQIMIDDLTNENCKLRQQIMQVQRSHDTRYSTSSPAGKKEDTDWVHVEQQASVDSFENEHPSHVEVLSHLQKKIKRLQTHIQVLGHGKKEAEEMVYQLHKEKTSLQQLQDKHDQQEQQRQVEIDMMLLAARKKADEAENDKAATVSSLERKKKKVPTATLR